MNINISNNLYTLIEETISNDIKVFDTLVPTDESMPYCVFQDVTDSFIRFFNDKLYTYVYQISICDHITNGIISVRNEIVKLQDLDLKDIIGSDDFSDGLKYKISVNSITNFIDGEFITYTLTLSIS